MHALLAYFDLGHVDLDAALNYYPKEGAMYSYRVSFVSSQWHDGIIDTERKGLLCLGERVATVVRKEARSG